MKTRLRKLINKNIIRFFKIGTTRMKLKYLIQVNQLYLADDLKQVINQEEQQKQTQISVSAQIKWKYYKNEYNDKILNLIFLRQGSSLIDTKLLELPNYGLTSLGKNAEAMIGKDASVCFPPNVN